MGLFSRMKNSIKSKANAAVDKAIDPEKELEMAIIELEEIRKKAIAELLSYKATAKRMEQQIADEEKRAAEWETRAMAAVKAGNDELARQALRERQNALAELTKIKRDRDEAASYAIELNKSRRTAETKLQMLKLKKGTMATQIRMARSGSSSLLGVDQELFDKLGEAEERIDSDAIEAEVNAAMLGEELPGKQSLAELDQRLLAAGASGGELADLNDPLAALKAKVASHDAERKAARAGSGVPTASGEASGMTAGAASGDASGKK